MNSRSATTLELESENVGEMEIFKRRRKGLWFAIQAAGKIAGGSKFGTQRRLFIPVGLATRTDPSERT